MVTTLSKLYFGTMIFEQAKGHGHSHHRGNFDLEANIFECAIASWDKKQLENGKFVGSFSGTRKDGSSIYCPPTIWYSIEILPIHGLVKLSPNNEEYKKFLVLQESKQ